MQAHHATAQQCHAAACAGEVDDLVIGARDGGQVPGLAVCRQVRQRHDGQVGGQALAPQHLAELRFHRRGVLACHDLARDADFKAGRMQQLQSFHRLAEVLQAARGIMPCLFRVIDADAERQRMRRLAQLRQLVRAADEGGGAIGQHQRRPQSQRMQQDVEDALQDQRFAAGEGETFHAQCIGFIQQWRQLRQRRRADAIVAGLAAFVAEGAGEIAGRAGMDPQLAQAVQQDGGGRGIHGRGW